MRATGDNQVSQLRALLRSALRSGLAVFGSREREQQLERVLEATRQAHIEQVTDLNRQIEATRQANIEQVTDLNRQIEAITTACSEQVQELERRISALSEAVTESARQLQQEKETDYQILMVHQNLLAEFRDMEPDFFDAYQRCKAFTMTSIERLYSLYKSVEYLCAAGIPGDLAECGVWRGGSCMLMSLALLRQGDTTRRIFMFDTFDGHPRPDAEKDIDIWGNRAVDEWQRREANGKIGEWGFASIAETRANLMSTGYPEDRLVFVEGMVERTVPEDRSERLALLRLDTDWYHSAQAALHHLYPKLVPGGVLIIDDYGHYKGQRQAVDAYFREIGCTPLLHRIDYSCRVMVKTPLEPIRYST
jgi:O-methyltransferase